jgi:hypothetical protein
MSAFSPLEALRQLDQQLQQQERQQERYSSTTVREYLVKAIETIDLQLGHGYASEHPQLIAAFMQTCAIDSVAGTLEREISYLTETIAQAIRESR